MCQGWIIDGTEESLEKKEEESTEKVKEFLKR